MKYRRRSTIRGPDLQKIPDEHMAVLRKFGPVRVAEARKRLCVPCTQGLSVGVCYQGLLPLTLDGEDCPLFSTSGGGGTLC